jgi:hypothetical protein
MHFMVKEMLNISEFTRNCVDFVNAQSLDFCAMFNRSLFVLFHFAIPLSVSLWFTSSNYPFGIIKLFFCLLVFGLQLLITPLVSFGLDSITYIKNLTRNYWNIGNYCFAFCFLLDGAGGGSSDGHNSFA